MSKTIPNGIVIGKAKTVVDIVDGTNREIRPRTKIKPKHITYHNTGNKGKGANAKAHNTLIHNLGDRLPRDTSHVSWHFAVDEHSIYQHLPLDELAYHCGDGIGKASGNMTSIGIEICMHVDQKNYAQAEENAIALGVYLAKLLNIHEANHVPHKKWSGKNCPQIILERDKGFTKFHNRIKAAIKGEDELEFKNSDLKATYNLRHDSAATRELLLARAAKRLNISKKQVEEGDFNAIALELAVHYAKQDK